MSDALADLLAATCKHCGAEPRDVTLNGVEYHAVRVHRSLGCPGAEVDGVLLGSVFALNTGQEAGQ